MKRVVIIDDEPDSLQIMRDVLEEYTCRVFTATTGKQGLDLVGKTNPDLVLLDLRLPDTDGEVLLPGIKSKFPRVKVIIGTAYADQKKKEELLKAGADGFFDKPIDLNAFEKKVRQLVGGLSEIRILVIDDEVEFCEIFREILGNDSETKWIIHTAQTGAEGLRLAKEMMPDLISLDVYLGGIRVKFEGSSTKEIPSGLDVYRELRSRGFQIPVVVLASYIDSSDAEELSREGVATIFSKIDLFVESNRTHFLNVLKRIALRGGKSPKAGSGNQ
ncbi:MAG: response regulator [Candidatus Omnitrophica bacterium]|nr:response regulator [Candidatus Omnitrophota bacterium]